MGKNKKELKNEPLKRRFPNEPLEKVSKTNDKPLEGFRKGSEKEPNLKVQGTEPNGSKVSKTKENEKKEEISSFQESQLKWIIGIMVFIVVLILVFFWVSNASKKFDYAGVTFENTKVGSITLYSTVITGFNQNGLPIEYRLNLRNDPRELKIPMQGNLNFIKNKPVYFSLDFDSGINECKDLLPIVDFSRFMYAMGFPLISSVTSNDLAIQYQKPMVDCTNKLNNTVLILTTGDESGIFQDTTNKNCYYLKVSNCEEEEVIEQLEVYILARFTGAKI